MATNVFFDWAESASRFIDFDVPTAADLNAPLDQVTSGFDAVEVRIDAIDTDLAGLTSPVQTQLDGKADITGETYSGSHNFTGATVTAATQATSDASTNVATTAFVSNVAFTTATGLTAASQAEMEAGTEAALRAMSPLLVAQAFSAQSSLPREARATNTILAAGDKGKFIEYTGSFTQTFNTAASLGAGWYLFLKNTYTDSVYLTPAGGATIDGATDFLMYPGEARLLQCDGTNFHSVILQGFRMLPATSGFFFEPPGYLGWDVFIQAPGGGGASGQRGAAGADRSGGGGGGAGSWAQAFIRATTAGTSHTITVGAAGPGGAAITADNTNGNNGTAGGNSSFGALLVATGGTAGAGGAGTSGTAGAASTSAGFVAAGGTAAGAGSNGASAAGTAATGWNATGGGGGSGIVAANTAADAAAGGISGTASSGSQIAGGTAGATAGTRPGGAGNAPTTTKRRGGTGGGGGASHASNAGADGGAGAHGGGGGGGSASVNGVASGAGGAGGAGYFEIVGVF
jgi:hypothetical protein